MITSGCMLAELDETRHLRADYVCHRPICACSGDEIDCACVARVPGADLTGCATCGASLLNLASRMPEGA